MALLVHCVTLADTEPITVPTQICGAPLRTVTLGSLRVHVSDVADPDTCFGNPEEQKKSALAFRQIQRELVAFCTPLPFDFPTLLENEDALAPFLATRQSEYEAALQRLAGMVQYEIVATWDDQPTDTATPVSGVEYRKRREQEMARVAAVDDKLKRVTATVVLDWRNKRERKTYRWFGLMRRDQREEFLNALRSAGSSQGVRIRLSGPWPPSEFVNPA